MVSPSSTVSTRKLFIILNPVAGAGAAEAVQAAVQAYFSCDHGSCVIHETSEQDDLGRLAKDAAGRGVDAVVAAGGDGTVSAVANGLVGTSTPMGILPLGTANVLARDLGIPTDLHAACALLAGDYETTAVDAMQVGGTHYFTQVGVGIDAMMIRDTSRAQKKRFGRVAYLWTAARSLSGFHGRRFFITIDGNEIRTRGTQVIVANSGTLGQKPLIWGPEIHLDDGIINVCIIRAKTFVDYARLTWNILRRHHRNDPKLRYEQAKRSVTIATLKPLPAQADGEVIGETPVEITVRPAAVRVIVPKVEEAIPVA